MQVAIDRNTSCVDFLLKNGSEVNQTDKDGKTALQLLNDVLAVNTTTALNRQYQEDRSAGRPSINQNQIKQNEKERFMADYGKVVKLLTDAGAR